MCQQIKFYFIIAALFFFAGNVNAIPFITTWQTDNYGSSDDNQISIPTTGAGYNYDIYWEEVGNPSNNGTEPTGQTGNYTITFPSIGTYRVEISGQFPQIYFNAGSYFPSKDSQKILTIEQWGDIAWTSMNSAFAGCYNLRINAVDAPDLSGVTDMSRMFYYARSFNDNINHWDVSNIENMSQLFRDTEDFNQPLSTWDVSKVTNMSQMFYFARAFNQDIKFVAGGANTGGDAWNVSNVLDMEDLFAGTQEFNQDIGNWDVSNVTNMESMFSVAHAFNQNIGGWTLGDGTTINGMFSGAESFNQDISGWNTTGVTGMSFLFRGATVFNQDISGWDIASVTDMSYMFAGAIAFSADITGWSLSGVTDMSYMFSDNTTFNQDISGWDVSNVLNMEEMFEGATSFNQDISDWDVTNVNDMSSMFEGATSFNQDIKYVAGGANTGGNAWDVSGVSDMRFMFSGATSFDQDLSNWDVTNVFSMAGIFSYSALSVDNYDNILIGWAAQAVKSNFSFGATGIYYCAGETARSFLISNFNWSINDEGSGCIAVYDGDDTGDPEILNGQPEIIDFGSGAFGVGKTRQITIENRQGVPATNFDISFSGTAFSIVTTPTSIAGSSSITVNVDLSGATVGTFTETMTITSDNFVTPFEFMITGAITGTPEPEIKVFEGSTTTGDEILVGGFLDVYGVDRGNNTSNDFTITNNGSATLNISAMSISGTAFSLGTAAPLTIPVGNSVTIVVTLDGTVAGDFYETLTITSDDSDESSFTIDVFGTIYGPDILVVDGLDIFGDPEILNGQVAPIDFGSLTAGSDIVRQLVITNLAQTPLFLSISDISITGSAFTFNTLPLPFGIGGEIDGMYDEVLLEITLSGATAGAFNETVTILCDDDTDPIFEFQITGQITAPEIEVFEGTGTSGTPITDGQLTAYDFGSDILGTDITQQITIENTGLEILNISSISISGSSFSLAAAAPTSIAIGASETVDIILSGATIGVFNETVTIINDDTDEGNFDFPITGEIMAISESEINVYNGPNTSGGIITDAQAAAIEFGSAVQGNDLTHQFTIENTGTAVLNISSISISGSAFSLTTVAPTTIAIGASETIDIELSGATIGVFSETVSINNDDLDESIFNFDLKGEITATPESEIVVYNGANTSGTIIVDGQASPLDFGSAVQGTDLTMPVTIENIGTAILNISSITISGTAFTISSTPTSVAIGGSETFDIILSGATSGVFDETISINSDDADESIFNFDLAGEITSTPTPEIAVYDGADTSGTLIVDGQVAPIDFGSVAQSTDITRPITIENNGSAILNISSISVTGSAYTLGAVPSSVAIGGTETFDIVLSGATAGGFTETISINNDDADESVFNFDLTGEITASAQPEIAVYAGNSTSGTAIINGQTSAVNVGTNEIGTAITQPFTIENAGSNDLLITDITITGSAFTIGSTLPNSISAGSSVTIDVILSGASAGTYSEIFTITNNDPDEAVFSFPISGEITEAEVSLVVDGQSRASGEEIVFEDAQIGSSKIRELTITNSGNANLVITNIIIVGDDFTLQSDLPGPLAPNESTILLIQFSPTSLGPKSAILTIQSVATADFTAVLKASGLSDIPPLEIFNVVTVQQNGKHDFLELRNIEFYNTNTVFIYNRWGNEVFKTTDYDNTTNNFIGNADNGNELPDGTYFYLIELNSGEIVKNGFFLLRR